MAKDYSKAKIYKLIDNRGYFYIGSTCNTLAKRLQKHKDKAVMYPERKLYKRFLEVGWDNVQHLLVTDDCNVKNEDELRKFEDSFIEPALNDPKCLNELRAFNYPGMDNFENKHEWIKASRNQYYYDNKDRINKRSAELVECSICKVKITRGHLLRHQKTPLCQPKKK